MSQNLRVLAPGLKVHDDTKCTPAAQGSAKSVVSSAFCDSRSVGARKV
jgi:hypothetical protein